MSIPARPAHHLRVLGLMSGTSLDGIDLALVDIPLTTATSALASSPLPPATLLSFTSTPWSSSWRTRVLAYIASSSSCAADTCALHADLGQAFADAIGSFLLSLTDATITDVKTAARALELDLIASHGQTVWHHVRHRVARRVPNAPNENEFEVHSSLQLGDAARLAELTGVTCVADFRTADVAAGGQGAPLASTFDVAWLSASSECAWRAVVNVGGIANATLLPPVGKDGLVPLAFDSGPGNALMDAAARWATDGALVMDEDGRLAASGKVNPALLDELLAHEYFARPAPKTTGRELFGDKFAREYYDRATQEMGLTPADVVATLTELTARSIHDAVVANAEPIGEVVVAGGGTRNPVLMARLGELFGSSVAVRTHEDLGIDSEAKEAMLFALLGARCVAGVPNNVPSCTGARGPRVLGKIVPSDNYVPLLKRIFSFSS